VTSILNRQGCRNAAQIRDSAQGGNGGGVQFAGDTSSLSDASNDVRGPYVFDEVVVEATRLEGLRSPLIDPVSLLAGVFAGAVIGGVVVRGAAGIAERQATGFLGHAGYELENAGFQAVRNQATTIGGRQFSGHALDVMQNRGIVPSVVENTIQTGQPFATRVGTQGFFDAVNNVRVIISDQFGRVVTVIRGAP
jgi:hypothetical protein